MADEAPLILSPEESEIEFKKRISDGHAHTFVTLQANGLLSECTWCGLIVRWVTNDGKVR